MFVREKRINGYTNLYLVETVREDGRAKQRIVKNLGRKEAVTASGALKRLASSVARYAERAVVLSQLEAGNPGACLHAHRPTSPVRAPVGGDRLPHGGRGSSGRAGVRAEADLHPDWVAGISIDAINAALIAGNGWLLQ